jgi:hypothetical protein
MYPSILSFETINKLKLLFECGIPRPQDVGHLQKVGLGLTEMDLFENSDTRRRRSRTRKRFVFSR